MKRYLIAGAAAALLLPTMAGAKPVPSKQVGMTSGVRAVYDAASNKQTVYGAVISLTFTKDDADKMLELAIESPKPVTIELWTGDIARGATSWDKGRKFLGNSGRSPEMKPTFKWMIAPGNYTALVLTTLPPGTKPDPFTISYGKEVRVATEQDKQEWDKAVAKYTVARIQQSQAKRPWAPNFTAIATDKSAVSVSQFRGKVLLIQFSAGTDQVMLDDIGYNAATYRRNKDRGYDMINVSLDTDQTIFDSMAVQYPPECHQIFDARTGNQSIADKFGVAETPDTVLIDASGHLLAHGLHREALEKLTLAAIAEANDYKEALKLIPDDTDVSADGADKTEKKPADSPVQ